MEFGQPVEKAKALFKDGQPDGLLHTVLFVTFTNGQQEMLCRLLRNKIIAPFRLKMVHVTLLLFCQLGYMICLFYVVKIGFFLVRQQNNSRSK